ncbi:hypothetical protein [Caballeronia sp. ATUFL_M2_KS44]|uniref:hypothetical protein n=1 Tax=Caballeronia sp. ATUFL_M2_KS44 TaxID=2921767 RepID=UPI0020280C51|nr:hypothetical protein [Caballeronia sp. ATUFL_M2_KS44]
MRYYAIRVTDPKTGEILVPNLFGRPGFTRVPADDRTYTYTSLNAGRTPNDIGGTNPAAQEIVLDIPTTFMHAPTANSFAEIRGVSLAEISQASDLSLMNVAVYGGMARGLPLAKPQQIGLLASGQIANCFGNWQGIQQSLCMYLQYGGSSPTSDQVTGVPASTSTVAVPTTNHAPANIVFQWKTGQPLLNAVVTALQSAFPQYVICGAITDTLSSLPGADVTGFFASLKQFAEFINTRSLSIVGGYAPDTKSYRGITITLADNVITVADGTVQTPPKQIAFNDLIGQPTWASNFQVQVMCVLRGDLEVGGYVTLPAGPATLGSGVSGYLPVPPLNALTQQLKTQSQFQGTFQIASIRHVGESRNPDGRAWISVIDLLYLPTPSSSGGGGDALAVSTVDSYPTLYNPSSTAASGGGSKYQFFVPQ